MTLIIAFLLMTQMGINNPFLYVGVFCAWIAHVLFYGIDSK